MEVPFAQSSHTQATHAKRPFGANLTNIVQNENRRRGLKRSQEQANLDDGPPVKRTRYNLRPLPGRSVAEQREGVQDGEEGRGGGFEPHKGNAVTLKAQLRRARSEALPTEGNATGASGSRADAGTKPRIAASKSAPAPLSERRTTEGAGGDPHAIEIPAGEPLEQWDEADKGDELCAVSYVKEIMLRLRRAEEEPGAYASEDYMTRQADISPRMRLILLDWLVDVHRKFELSQSALFLCVSLLDRFLSRQAVPRQELQLTGCACLWVASKYHEIYAPEINDFVYISDDAFTEDDLIRQEARLVQRLGFALTVPTPLPFAERFIKVATHGMRAKHTRKLVQVCTRYLLEHALMNYPLSRERPSLVAAACLCYAMLGMGRQRWNETLQDYTGYSAKDLFPALTRLDKIMKASPSDCKHRAVRKKYAHKRHGQVSMICFSKVNIKSLLRKTKKQ